MRVPELLASLRPHLQLNIQPLADEVDILLGECARAASNELLPGPTSTATAELELKAMGNGLRFEFASEKELAKLAEGIVPQNTKK